MMILLTMVLLLVPFFYFFVLFGVYQNHKGTVMTFYSSSKEYYTFEDYLTLISNVNFDLVSKGHLLSRCGDIEIDNNLFRYKETFIIFGFVDFLLVKVFLYFKRNRNILGFVEKTDQKLIIMRAVSGAGKSTRAKELVGNGIIHSTDDIMLEIGEGDYAKAFTMELNGRPALGVAHRRNLFRAIDSMKKGITPVIIDNTNLRRRDIKPYVKEALKLGFKDENIEIIDLGTNGLTAEELASRNSHGVSLEIINDMCKVHKNSGSITLYNLFENGK